jgi:hypothetical protein
MALCAAPHAVSNSLAPGEDAPPWGKLYRGLGPKLAVEIEADRQKNGDFDKFFALQRAKGNGPKTLEARPEYFTGEND